MKIITEEMRFRQRLCEYALKYGVTKAARKYQTNRQFVYRQLKKYDGNVRSLALRSRKPKHSPNAHTEEELTLIRRMLKRNGVYGLAESIRQMLQQRVYKELRQYVQTDTKERLPEAGDSQKKLYELQPDGWRISGA